MKMIMWLIEYVIKDEYMNARGLHYNDMFFKDEIINECNLAQIIGFVWMNFGKGQYCPVVPTEKEIDLYDKLKANEWLKEDIWINEGSLYINNEEFYIEDIESSKIENVSFVDDNDRKIVGDNMIAIFGQGSDYIILQNDIINLSIGDVSDISNLEDCRDYFLKFKEYWYMEQMNRQKKLIEKLTKLQNND